MRVLINAVSIKVGGSLTVLDRLVSELSALEPDSKWLVAHNPRARLSALALPNVVSVETGETDRPDRLMTFYERDLHRAAARHRADVLFSVTNYLPFRPLSCPSVLLIQNAGHFSELYQHLQERAFGTPLQRLAWRAKTHWVRRSAHAATYLTVQTEALADAITEITGRPRATISVIPHGPGLIGDLAAPVPEKARSHPFRIGYVTKWGAQKNFGVLFAAARILRDAGRDVRLVLTLDPAHGPNRQVLAEIDAQGLTEIVENRGELDRALAAQVYDTLDLFVFPSLIESFGFPIVEAMARAVPLLVADTASNREVAGSGADTFPAHDPEVLAGAIARLMDSPSECAAASARAAHRARDYSWKRAAEQSLALLKKALHESSHGARGLSRSLEAAGR